MRELILKMSMSIDGFVATTDGGIKWIFETSDAEGKAWTLKTVSDASLHIMGSRTFQDMAAFWPTSTDVFAATMNQVPKAVFSRRGAAALGKVTTTMALKDARADTGGQKASVQPGAESWASAYVASGDLEQEIAKLKAGDGKPIVAHGGAGFARSLIAKGLVDQYALVIHPIALGAGLPIFSELTAPRKLKIVSSTSFASGVIARVCRAA